MNLYERQLKLWALDICIRLWLWLSSNPYKDKEDWPGWEYLPEMENDCPLCAIRIKLTGLPCQLDCPVWWNLETDVAAECVSCVDKRIDTPFNLWLGSNDAFERAQHAMMIVNRAEKARDKILGVKDEC